MKPMMIMSKRIAAAPMIGPIRKPVGARPKCGYRKAAQCTVGHYWAGTAVHCRVTLGR